MFSCGKEEKGKEKRDDGGGFAFPFAFPFPRPSFPVLDSCAFRFRTRLHLDDGGFGPADDQVSLAGAYLDGALEGGASDDLDASPRSQTQGAHAGDQFRRGVDTQYGAAAAGGKGVQWAGLRVHGGG
jgi:hypothetical protein